MVVSDESLDGASRFVIRTSRMQSSRCFHDLLLGSCGHFNICATICVDLWFIADYRWDESSGGKFLKLKLDLVMTLDD